MWLHDDGGQKKQTKHIHKYIHASKRRNGSATLGVFTHRNLLIFFGLLRYATQRARDFKDIKDISIRWNVYPAYFPE